MHANWIGGIINLNWQGNLYDVQYTAFVLFRKGCTICDKKWNFDGGMNLLRPMMVKNLAQ